MTEVPDYLLQRSRERRAALGLPPTGGEPPAEGGGEAPPSGGQPAATATPATTEAAPPATAPETAPAVPEPEPEPELVPAGPPPGPRSGIPGWMMPVLVFLPFWAIVYMGGFGTAKTAASGPSGPAIFAKSCAVCHGARGEGGVGPKLAGGEAKVTFPNEQDHIAWVQTGSGPHKGQPYGDPNRPGGQHIAKTGGMPPFQGQLSDAEIRAVVTFERTGL